MISYDVGESASMVRKMILLALPMNCLRVPSSVDCFCYGPISVSSFNLVSNRHFFATSCLDDCFITSQRCSLL